ncbi:MAG: molybdenum cofactor biosynthesis protein MoaE [Thermodesulfobacteriota bacterium]
MVKVTSEVLAAEPLIKRVSSAASGAVAVFVGVAREFSEGRRVVFLQYEAYREMAERKMEEIVAEIKQKWTVNDVAMVHRVGVLQIGESSIVIAVSAAHRRDALAACQYAIERVKEIVPIWKKEVFEDGSRWVGWTG